MKADPTFWLLARAAGVTAFALLTAAVLVGLTVKSRPLGTRVKAAAVTDLHRFLSLLALLATGLHGATLALDRAVPIPLAALVVPGLSPYRPLWTGLGVLAAELALAIHVSFTFRRRIGSRNWRRLHYLTYAVFGAAVVHGLAAGTDAGRLAFVYVAAVAAVAGLTAWRVLTAVDRERGAPRVPDRDRPIAV